MARYIDAEALVQNIVNTPTHALDDIAFWHSDALTGLANRQNEIIDMIMEIPSADVAPVQHGEWQRDDDTGESLVRCSVCREVYECEIMPVEFAMFYHYCPNCGAKMDGGGA